MPELPEVETVARSLRPKLVGRTIAGVWTSGLPLRRPVDAAALARAASGARVDSIDRTGKYLLVRLSLGDVLVVHLGMSGQLLYVRAAEPRAPHTHMVLDLGGGDELRFVDPRRFGVIATAKAASVHTIDELAALGPDPLSADFTVEYLARQAASARRASKEFLLDQTRVAGLGNIYAAEALFVAGISPRRRADRLGPARIARLHAAVVDVLRRGVENRGTSLRDYVDADGAAGANQHHLHVYGREGAPCRTCGTTIRRLVQGARSTFYCPRCQR